jgi:flagellar hook protein FlgE
MSFDVALSGIRAASSDLSITGNNIANASTTGFKSSRAEFGDVYATSVMGAGNKAIGSGVQLLDVSQNFTQGNVTFTENELDLAISGNGFFVVRRDGAQYYTRSGAFGLDRDGYVTSNTGARLQGFPVNGRGQITGIQSDIRIQANNIPPRATTAVESVLNLDSSEPVLQSVGTTFRTEGNAIGVARSGQAESTRTNYTTPVFDLLNPIDLTNPNASIEFDVQLQGSSGNDGSVHISLDSSNVPAMIQSYNDLRTLVSVINAQLFQPGSQIDVVASIEQLGNDQYRLQFNSVQQGENSEITIANGNALAEALQLPAAGDSVTSNPGIAAVDNGYPRQSIDIVDAKGNVVTYTSAKGASAATIASELNAITGVTATATTTMRFVANDYVNDSGNMQVKLNGVTLTASTLQELEQAINRLTTSTLPGISAEIDDLTGDLVVRSAVGDDLKVSITGGPNDGVGIIGGPNTPMTSLAPTQGNAVVIGGQLEIVLAEGYSATNADPLSTGLFDTLNETAFSEVVLNAFDPSDKNTYNHATSLKIYDSLGNPHVMTQYFVRQDYDPTDPTTNPNQWIMYVQIDGHDVGEPDTTLPPPQNTLPTLAAFRLQFNPDGSLNRTLSDQVLISNWTPLDAEGNPNGALGPQNILAGGTMNIPDPPTSSNFTIDLTGTTQFSSVFSVNDVDQNGYTTGRLSGLNIDETGIIFARFTNGESMVLGQVILANFTNNQGLQPVGDSMWAENYESGPPNIGTPGSATLGSIQSGALEESNVDLSEELVRLIIAQRNFQASAKTIETTNQVTQTVINLR